MRIACVHCCLLLLRPRRASGQATSNGLLVKVLAEVESGRLSMDRTSVKLIPADRVAPGDQVIYTLEIRNAGSVAIPVPTVRESRPAHTVYVADSATGPGAEVSYSVDGGTHL